MGRRELPEDIGNIVESFLKAGKKVVGYQLESDSGTGQTKLIVNFSLEVSHKVSSNCDDLAKIDKNRYRAKYKYKSPAKSSRDKIRFAAWLEKRFSNRNDDSSKSKTLNSVENDLKSVVTEIETDLKLLDVSNDANRSVCGSSLVDPCDIAVNTNLEVIGDLQPQVDELLCPVVEDSAEFDAQDFVDRRDPDVEAKNEVVDLENVLKPDVEEILGQIWHDFDDSCEDNIADNVVLEENSLNNEHAETSDTIDDVNNKDEDETSPSEHETRTKKRPRIKKVVHDTRGSVYKYIADVDDGSLIVYNESDGNFEIVNRTDETNERRVKYLTDVLESSVDVIGPMNVFRFIMSDVWE